MVRKRGAIIGGSLRIGLLALATLVAAGSAFAQGAIEKCVAADGKVTYSDSGCAQGSKIGGYVERERSKADAAAARRAANLRARQQDFARRRAKVAADEEARKAESAGKGKR